VFRAAPLQRAIGAAIILFGAILIYLARAAFASWRFRAQIEPGHELATTGPFRLIRHPLYAGLDLLALGTAIWIPTVLAWLGAALMVLAGDLRARAEEPLLERAFGDTYRIYQRRSWRFLPGVY
jgi:protein-S-isoprenylcysteine O-methyltransferase Ste14